MKDIQDSIEAKEQARLDKEALDLEHQNPLLWVMNCYKSVAAPLLHNVPGSPSIIALVLNIYSDKIADKMAKKPAFNIKLNMALFRFCGVDVKIKDQSLPKAFLNELATAGYVAQSPKREAYKAILPKVKSVNSRKLDFRILTALDTVEFKASKSLWYKSIMLITTLGVQSYTFEELSKSFDSVDSYTQGVTILQAGATVLYTAPLAVKLGGSILTALTGVSISVNRTAGTKVISTLLGGEAAARYLAVIAVFISFQSAHEQYALGNDSAGHLQVGMAINLIHQQLAYAATKGIGRGVFTAMAEGAIQRGAAVRVMQFGLASLAVPVFGEVALLISSVIALGMVAYSAAEGIHSASKSSVYHMFYHHLDAISASQIPILNDKHCHELYTSTQLPKEARGLFEEIKNISDDDFFEFDGIDDYKMSNLSWRAVIPLHLQDYSLDSIRAMVELPAERLTETSMRDRQFRATRTRIVQSIDDIVTYYKYMTNPDSDPDLLGGGRRYLNKDDRLKISNALELGNFIPAVGHEHNLETVKDGRKHIISFDHLYFREGASDDGPLVAGISWEDSNERSNEITSQFTI